MSSQADLTAAALRWLAQREYAEMELRSRLKQRFPSYAQDIDVVIQLLQQQDLQSDQRYCEAYCRSRINKGYGPRWIRQSLQSKGLSASIIDAAIAEAEVDWQQLAQQVWEKKFGSELNVDFNLRMKQRQYMHRRGFDWGNYE